jgi:hypothetical protein
MVLGVTLSLLQEYEIIVEPKIHPKLTFVFNSYECIYSTTIMSVVSFKLFLHGATDPTMTKSCSIYSLVNSILRYYA